MSSRELPMSNNGRVLRDQFIVQVNTRGEWRDWETYAAHINMGTKFLEFKFRERTPEELKKIAESTRRFFKLTWTTPVGVRVIRRTVKEAIGESVVMQLEEAA